MCGPLLVTVFVVFFDVQMGLVVFFVLDFFVCFVCRGVVTASLCTALTASVGGGGRRAFLRVLTVGVGWRGSVGARGKDLFGGLGFKRHSVRDSLRSWIVVAWIELASGVSEGHRRPGEVDGSCMFVLVLVGGGLGERGGASAEEGLGDGGAGQRSQ